MIFILIKSFFLLTIKNFIYNKTCKYITLFTLFYFLTIVYMLNFIKQIGTFVISGLWLIGLSINQMYAATVSATGWVKLEQTDLDNIGLGTQAYTSTMLETFKLLWYGIAIWWVKYIVWKVFGLFGTWGNN